MRVATSALTLIAVCTALALAGGILFNGISSALSIASLLLGSSAAAFAFFQTRKEKTLPFTEIDWAIAFVFFLAAARSFLWLVYEAGAELRIGSPYNIGDLALHVQIIRYLASGVPLWPENPIFLEGVLRYPVGSDLWNAILLDAGIPMIRGLIWAGLGGSLLTWWWLRRWGGSFAVATLLFSGGVSAFLFFSPSWPLGSPDEIEWKNLFLTSFVTQRGYLWALPAGITLLVCWRERMNGRTPPAPFWIECLFYALMPLFHLHTFLFLSALLAGCFLFSHKENRLAFFLVGAICLLPASLLVWTVTGGFAVTGGVQWFPGWLSGEKGLAFWWINFGISLPLFIVLAFMIFWKRERDALAFVSVSLLVLIACFFFRFAPWAWDNVKLMLWVWIATAPFLWEIIIRPLPRLLQVSVLFVLFFSGAWTLVDGLSNRHLYTWVNRKQLDNAGTLLQGLLPAETRLAVAPVVPHPAALQGFPVAVGYPGHLWSHGYNYRATELALESFFSSGQESLLLAPVTHVVIGPQEREKFGNSVWIQPPPGWHLIKQVNGFRLYGRNDSATDRSLPIALPNEEPDPS